MSRVVVLIVCLILPLACATLPASDSYAIGHVNSDGYRWNGSHWVWPADGTLWTRTAFYDRYGRRGWYYRAYVVHAPAPHKPPSVDSTDFETELARYLADKQKREQRFEMLRAAGLIQPGASYGAGGYGQSLSLSGNTLYGYSLAPNLSAAFDINVTMQQYLRGLENAQQLAGQAHADTTTVIQSLGDPAARVAEILAKGQADAERIRAAQTPKLERREFKFGGSGPGPAMPEADEPARLPVKTSRDFAHLNADCASCHSGAKLQGGFDVTKFDGLTRERRVRIVLDHIGAPAGSDKLMPKGGPALAPAKQVEWLVRAGWKRD